MLSQTDAREKMNDSKCVKTSYARGGRNNNSGCTIWSFSASAI